ncbi:ras-related protein Rab-39A-like [Coturnix japonica]|nr:ras-related protein Rab-39A-like [Coturnix japonica]XP_015705583.2 ras-related protein Rab-39A-like [Coturnix japonica]
MNLCLSPAPHPDLKNLQDYEVYSSPKKMMNNGVKTFCLLLESDLAAFTEEHNDVSGFSACERTQRGPVWFCLRSITRSYYRNSVGGLLVFDITNRRSFEHVKDWLEEAKMHVQPFQIVFLLVGHKCDLVSQREVTREEAEKLSSDCGMKYIETSAKDATNVEESFTILTRDIYELVKKGEITIQDGWEGVKSGFVPNVVHSSEEAVKPRRQCVC